MTTTTYSMQFFWTPDDQPRAGLGPLIFSSKTQAAALRQARRLWEVQPHDHEARGYRLIDEANGALVYEYLRP